MITVVYEYYQEGIAYTCLDTYGTIVCLCLQVTVLIHLFVHIFIMYLMYSNYNYFIYQFIFMCFFICFIV